MSRVQSSPIPTRNTRSSCQTQYIWSTVFISCLSFWYLWWEAFNNLFCFAGPSSLYVLSNLAIWEEQKGTDRQSNFQNWDWRPRTDHASDAHSPQHCDKEAQLWTPKKVKHAKKMQSWVMLGIQVVMAGSFQWQASLFIFYQLLSYGPTTVLRLSSSFIVFPFFAPRRAWHRPTKAAIPSPRPWRPTLARATESYRMSQRFNLIQIVIHMIHSYSFTSIQCMIHSDSIQISIPKIQK